MSEQEKNLAKQPEIQERIKKRIQKNALFQGLAEHGRIPPQAVDLEEAVLGALMLEQNALTAVIDILKPEVFYKESHQVIYAAIHRLFADTFPLGSKIQFPGCLAPIWHGTCNNKIVENVEFSKTIISKRRNRNARH